MVIFLFKRNRGVAALPAPGIASDLFAPGHAWEQFMYPSDTEYERRERLSAKCSELARVAMDQGDIDTWRRLTRNQLRLDLLQITTNRLNYPDWFEHGLENPDKNAAEAFRITQEFVQLIDQQGGRDLVESAGLADLL